jgi:Cupin-like domain
MKHANRHIARFLEHSPPPSEDLQVVTNGCMLTANALCRNMYDASKPILIKDNPEALGMVVPKNLTMQKLADIIGPGYPISVIDVQHQEELDGWTLGDLVEYFEDEERLLHVRLQQQALAISNNSRRRRKSQTNLVKQPKVLNQISLEFRNTPLASLVKSPKFVRDLDWIDAVWQTEDSKPQTQYYCLTSTAGCFTDFHVDFGGTSVWYHVLSGSKHFLLIPPTVENLQLYEDWLCRPDQSLVFFPDIIREKALKVILQQSETLYIPCGWIHAVYTPIDSIVIGGNFLHGLDIAKQIDVHSLEMRTRVPAKFRFPKYLALAMHTGVWYVEKLRQGNVCQREINELPTFLEALRQWSRVPSDPFMVKAMQEIGDVQSMLQCFQDELHRTMRDGICPNPDYVEDIKPKIRLTLSDAQTTPSVEAPFRIKLSSGSQFSSVPLPTKKRRLREDLDSVSSVGDDEWKPKSSEASKSRETKAKFSKDTMPTAPKPLRVISIPPRKVGSSRQRLLKRMR